MIELCFLECSNNGTSFAFQITLLKYLEYFELIIHKESLLKKCMKIANYSHSRNILLV